MEEEPSSVGVPVGGWGLRVVVVDFQIGGGGVSFNILKFSLTYSFSEVLLSFLLLSASVGASSLGLFVPSFGRWGLAVPLPLLVSPLPVMFANWEEGG